MIFGPAAAHPVLVRDIYYGIPCPRGKQIRMSLVNEDILERQISSFPDKLGLLFPEFDGPRRGFVMLGEDGTSTGGALVQRFEEVVNVVGGPLVLLPWKTLKNLNASLRTECQG